MAVVRIASLGTAVPGIRLDQAAVRALLTRQPGLSRRAQRLVGAAVDNAAIATRYTAIDEFAGLGQDGVTDASAVRSLRRPRSGRLEGRPPMFFDSATGELLHPPTGARNAVFTREATPLALAAATDALGRSGFEASDVTHVITVSCTGFFAPGPDYELVRRLGLRPETRRLNIGFMGCYGYFPALRAAVDSCLADPDAVVLIACVELCTLHLRVTEDPDVLVAASVFADGAGAAVVTGRPGPGLRVDALHSVLAPGSEHEMTWTIGDLGFEMTLSSYVPRVLEAQIGDALAPLRPSGAWTDVEHWAVHPGGRAILDRVQEALGLSDAQLEPSRAVLRDFGNMSSATVPFILERLLADAAPGERVAATAFGPGLTVESALFTAVGGGFETRPAGAPQPTGEDAP
ncbi:type III polyketide synthase [Gryllotalpicola ginsengisoli]|uniref:type III polyketide synthase n=1 Tax=Gryllotalpicola ginsengisoli TaxID=444608 RepID=UPI0003B7371F|nr:type III polyketide synthase [Gryllotalpicola ginsengisoli]